MNADVIDANTIGELIDVRDDNGTPRLNEFVLNNSNGNFTIAKKAGVGFYVGADENQSTFDFTIKFSLDGVEIFQSFEGSIGNIRPTFTSTPTIYTPPSTYLEPGAVTMPNSRILKYRTSATDSGVDQILNGFNGSADTTLNTKDLTWEITSIKCIDGKNIDSNLDWLADATGLGEIVSNFSIDFDDGDWPVLAQTLTDQFVDQQVYYTESEWKAAFGDPPGSITEPDSWRLLQNVELKNLGKEASNFFLTDINNIASGYNLNEDKTKISIPSLQGAEVTFNVQYEGIGSNFITNVYPSSWTNGDVYYNTMILLEFAEFEIKLQCTDGQGQSLQNEVVLRIKYTQ